MEEAMTYLVIEEAPVSYPGEVGRYFTEAEAEAAADEMAEADPAVAYMVMTVSEYAEYREMYC